MEDKTTINKINIAAKKEFLNKGFEKASLRQIVKDAQVTTGAFYGYMSSKEELFLSIVEPHARYLLNQYTNSTKTTENLSLKEQTSYITNVSMSYTEDTIEYIYKYYDEFKILLCRAGGTKYENFVHQLVLEEENFLITYMNSLIKSNHDFKPLSKDLIHMISSGFFTAIFEIIMHDMPKESAREYINQCQRFYSAGWQELFDI